jgi:hypothetical protein
MAGVVIANITPGEPRLHIWCDRCMTSAGIEVDALILGEHGVSKVGTYRACLRCDREES